MKKIIKIILILILCISIPFFLFTSCNVNYNDSGIMGTFLNLNLKGKNSEKAKKDIISEIERIQKLLDVNYENSDINKINNAPINSEIEISLETLYLIKESKKLYDYTNGIYNPAIYSILELYGFVPNMTYRIPTSQEIEKALICTDYSNIQILCNEQNNPINKIKKTAEVYLDFGSIGKGYAVEKCKEIANNYNVDGIINLGGNIYSLGDSKIGIANPRLSNYDYNSVLNIDNIAISTSGDYERFFIENQVRYHHIMGKDGKPANVDNIISVTVVSENAFLGDILSTAIFASGMDMCSELMNYYNFSAVILTSNNKVFTFGELKNFNIVDKNYVLAN